MGAVHASASFPAADSRFVRPGGAALARFGPYSVNLASGDLRKFGYRIKLQPKSFLILQALLERPGEMVTREDLKNRLWAEHTFVEFESSLNVAVRRLREALNDEAQKPVYIETVPRQGYRFIGVPEFVAEAPKAQIYGPAVPAEHETPLAFPAVDRPRLSPLRIALSCTAALVVIVALAGFWRTSRKPSPPPVPSSVAVLPFADLSPEKNQSYLSDGMAEELLNELAKTPGLHVAARTSSFQFRNPGADLADIARQLGVATILEGSVQRDGKRVRISAELVKAADGFQLWAGKYDRDVNDVFAVQDEIARAISGELRVRLLDTPAGAPPRGTTPEAYNAYLQGRYFYEHRTIDDLARAEEYFQQAVQLDPGFARGWSALAWALIARTEAAEGSASFDEGYRSAQSAAQRALQLDPNLAEAHAAIGRIRRSYWDWTGARAAFDKALALEPQNAVVLLGASGLQASLGNFDEALALNRRAVALDPLSVVAHLSLGMHAYYAGQQQLARDALQKALAISPNSPEAHYLLGLVYLEQSRAQQALAEFEKDQSSSERSVGEALAYAALQRGPQADAALQQLIANYQGQAAYQIAEVYAFRGDSGHALKWLEVARAHRDAGLSGLQGDPLLKNLAGDARFSAFLQALGYSH